MRYYHLYLTNGELMPGVIHLRSDVCQSEMRPSASAEDIILVYGIARSYKMSLSFTQKWHNFNTSYLQPLQE